MNAIETLVLDLIGEDSSAPDVFPDTEAGMLPIRDSINAAIQEIAGLTGAYERTYHIPTRAERQMYRIVPASAIFGYVRSLSYRDQHRKLDQTSLTTLAVRDPWFMQTNGAPREYFHVGMDQVGLYPIPSDTGTVLEARCMMFPAFYTNDADPIHLRTAFQRAAAHYAVSEFYISRGDAKRATKALGDYLEVAGLDIQTPEQADRAVMMGQYRHGNQFQRQRN